MNPYFGIVMKKSCVVIISLLLFMSLFVGCSPETVQNEDGGEEPYNTRGEIPSTVEIQVLDNYDKVWMGNESFTYAEIRVDEKGEEYVALITSEQGKKAFRDALSATLGGPLSFIVNDRFILSMSFADSGDVSAFRILNQQRYDAVYMLNLITDAPDKMKGVKKPQSIVSETEVQQIVCRACGVAPEALLNYTCTLQFDENWMGWKYYTECNIAGKIYQYEINAVSGKIVDYFID